MSAGSYASSSKIKSLRNIFAKHFSNLESESESESESENHGEDNTTGSDALARVQNRYEEQARSLNEDLRYWQQKKIDLFVANDKIIAENYTHQKRSIQKRMVKFVKNLITFVETPHYYLNYLIAHTSLKINRLSNRLNALLYDLNQSGQSADDLLKTKVEICNTNIALINTHLALFNNINREIDYSVKWVNALERVTMTLLFSAVRLKTTLPELDFGITARYRLTLYNAIHRPLERIQNFLSSTMGLIGRARVALDKDPEMMVAGSPANKLESDAERTQDVDKPSENIKDESRTAWLNSRKNKNSGVSTYAQQSLFATRVAQDSAKKVENTTRFHNVTKTWARNR